MNQTNVTEVVHGGGIKDIIIFFLPYVILAVVLFFVIKLYIKLSRYLDRKNKQD
jgi:large-conductance mechanosensitive channel